MIKEDMFFNALRDVFVGAKVEGESGYVNLMRIKARYYEKGVFPHLQKDIAEALKPFPEFREELFDRLYTFFHRYFSESGSIYFRYTPLHERVYEQVYTDDCDVMLFWKTHMLHYVKTDLLFRSMETEVDGFRFFFDVSGLEHKKANEKRALMYEFRERRKDGTLAFIVAYSEGGRKTNLNEIRKAIKDALGLSRYTDAVPAEETLERAFRLFERQSEVDYFINKDARKFLREQFDLWLYQYVFEPEQRNGTVWSEKRIRQLQVLKNIAYKIIDFMAQFEDELLKIWNKPKFVLDSHYVITLDRVVAQEGGLDVLRRLLEHPGMKAQVQEWREMGMVDEDFALEDVWESNLLGKHLHPRYQYLPVDTRYFPDLEMAILGLFDHLDQILDGWLIKSENYQALKTLLPKFRERVKCIYIDPPYNTGNDEFIYDDRFRHSSWLTMMENRLAMAKEWLREDGILFVNIDENEQFRLRGLLEKLFPNSYLAPLIWLGRAGKGGTATKIHIAHEYVECTAKVLDKAAIQKIASEVEPGNYSDEKGTYKRELLRQWGQGARREDRPSMYFPIPTPYGDVWPTLPDGSEGRWRYGREKVYEMVANGELDFMRDERTGEIKVYRKIREGQTRESAPGNILNDVGTSADGTKELQNLFGDKIYPTTKPTTLVIKLCSLLLWDKQEIVLDFFAGSGTTGHAVTNLNRQDGGRRKYILVEMADCFDTVLLPRIKKVVFSDQWKDGRAQEDGKGISHFVKYFCLEQYEDVLRRAHYTDAEPLFIQADPYSQYVFLRDIKLMDNARTGERAVTVDMQKDEISVDLSKLYENIDLAETLSYVTGKWIRRIRPHTDDPTRPGEVEFEDGTRVDFTNPPWELVKPLVWW